MNLFIKILAFTLFAGYVTLAVIAIPMYESSPAVPMGPSQPQTTPSPSITNKKSEVLKPEAKIDDLADPLKKLIRSRPIVPVPMTGQSQFAFDLYQAIRSQSGNLIYSPYSISTAMAMAYVGAKGTTEQQISKTLHFPIPQNRLRPAVKIADLKLSDGNADGFKLQVANSLWGQNDYSFLPDFLKTLAKNFNTELQLVDFKQPAGRQQASSAINQWVSHSTAGMIKDIISEELLTEDTRLILANAIYFKAEWNKKLKLDPPNVEFKFTLLDGNTVTFPRMSITEEFKYTEGEGYQAVELPYKGERMSMVIVLPAKGQFENIEKQFNAPFVGQVLGGLSTPQKVDLYMPKFKYEAQLSLENTLADMGMPDAFNAGEADFSGMDGTKKLFISNVIHKAVIAVDETGTEAAAATIITMVRTECGGSDRLPVSMRINRPFLFFIRDMESGTVLFIGRVLNPLKP